MRPPHLLAALFLAAPLAAGLVNAQAPADSASKPLGATFAMAHAERGACLRCVDLVAFAVD